MSSEVTSFREAPAPLIHGGSRFTVIRPRGAKKGLFWVTPDAPQSSAFRELGRDQRVVCLRAPIQPEEQPPLSLEQLAVFYADSIQQFPDDDAITLVGYCIAGVLAREAAIQLQRRGRVVKSLIMIDPPDPAKSLARLRPDPLVRLLSREFHRWRFHSRRLLALSFSDALAYLGSSARGVVSRRNYGKSKRAYAAAISSDDALPDQFNSSYHMSVAAFLNSVPAEYSGSAYVIRPADAARGAFSGANARWQELIAGGIQVIQVPGDSNTMWQEPAVKYLAAEIRASLGR